MAPRSRSGSGLRLRIEDMASSPLPLSWWSPRAPVVACCGPTLCPVEGSISFLCQASGPERHSTGLHLPSCCAVAQSFPALCSPTDCSTPGFPVLRYLPEFAQTQVHCVDDVIHHLTDKSSVLYDKSHIFIIFIPYISLCKEIQNKCLFI